MVALYHYCNLDGAGMYDAEEGAARSGAAAGFLVQPRLFESFGAPLLDYGVLETEAARSAVKAQARRDKRADKHIGLSRSLRSAAVRSRRTRGAAKRAKPSRASKCFARRFRAASETTWPAQASRRTLAPIKS